MGITKKNKIKIIILIVISGIVIFTIGIIYNNNKFSSFVSQGDTYMSNKKYEKALSLYNEALNTGYVSMKNNKEIENVKQKKSKAKTLNESVNDFNHSMKCIEHESYEYALKYLKKVAKEDTDNYNNAIKKIKEIIPAYDNQMIEKAKKVALKKDFDIAIEYIQKALDYDPNNNQLISLKNEYNKQKDQEFNAKMEAEAKAEKEKYKPKKITSSDNYDVWSVYLRKGLNTFKINVTNGDAENVIVKLHGSLLINEIGQGSYANSIQIPNDDWYRLEIECPNGYKWNFE